ncbi:MAG: hypothetical protein KUG80_07330 [Gammaproteobacteria bacterium]|nr:hypothetical protein [Gammaproteobacteria bacterium]
MPASVLFSSIHKENLRRICSLRNFYIIALTLIILPSRGYIVSIDVYAPGALAALSLLFILNLLTLFYLSRTRYVSENMLFIQLLIDIFGVFAILYFFGGSSNPFVSYLLVPVTIAAATLSKKLVLSVFVVAAMAYSALMLPLFTYDQGAAATHHSQANEFSIHLVGMWINFIFSSGLLSFFMMKMSRTLQEKEHEINKQREELSRNTEIVSLGTLAADAAHELSTPLTTMAITIKELQNDIPDQQALNSDLDLLRAQIDSCKSILTSLTDRTGFSRSESIETVAVNAYVRKQIHNISLICPSVNISCNTKIPDGQLIQRDTAFLHSIKNLLRNAAEASETNVHLDLALQDEQFLLTCANDGHDITRLDQNKLGTPFYSNKQNGLGLGLFLAKSVIEGLGGQLSWHSKPEGGTIIRVTVPLKSIQS